MPRPSSEVDKDAQIARLIEQAEKLVTALSATVEIMQQTLAKASVVTQEEKDE